MDKALYDTDAAHPDERLERKLQALYTLNRDKKVDLGFRTPYINLLNRFGDPHLHLPPVIHVAGTNGKGSVIAFMRAILEAAGYKVHVYTSPHLVKFNERIVLAGQMIGDRELEDLLDEAMRLNGGGEVTFFEITTALAFAAFSKTPADIVLLETGLGGRLDCTNVIENPLATVIMPIGYDHMEFLGDTLEQIASEKAGIMKPGSPCIVAPQPHESVRRTLMDIGRAKGSSTHLHGSDWFIEPGVSHDHEIRHDGQVIPFPNPSLTGNHQIFNAGTAIRVLNVAKGFHIPECVIKEGVTGATWPGRLQRLDPALFGLGKDWNVLLDGGHNESAAQALAHHLIFDQQGPHYLVTAMLNRRSPEAFLLPLLPCLEGLAVLEIPDEPATHSREAIAYAAKKLGFSKNIYMLPNINNINQWLNEKRPGTVLIAGSLYLTGRVIKDKL